MPLFIAGLLGGLISITSTLVGRVMLALGVGVVSYTGITTALDYAQAQAIGALSGGPAELTQLLGYLGVGEFISIIASALVARLSLIGLASGVVKRFVLQS